MGRQWNRSWHGCSKSAVSRSCIKEVGRSRRYVCRGNVLERKIFILAGSGKTFGRKYTLLLCWWHGYSYSAVFHSFCIKILGRLRRCKRSGIILERNWKGTFCLWVYNELLSSIGGRTPKNFSYQYLPIYWKYV